MRRVTYLLLTLICFILCVLILKFFNHESFIRGFMGDLIFVILIYSAVKCMVAVKPVIMAIMTLVMAYATEFLQYLKIIHYLGLEHNRLAKIILGSTFDPIDLLAYTLGVIIAYLIDRIFIEKIFRTKAR